MQVLGLCGSLRAASINRALLGAAARLAPPGMRIARFDDLGALPLFNPDLESRPPAAVVALKQAVAAADALLVASPEYARGVSGVIKNALDWLVSFEPFVAKPVAVLNASPRAHHADDALRETLRTMSAVIVEGASVSLPLLGAHLTEDGMVSSADLSRAIRSSLAALHAFLAGRPASGGPAFPVT
jgi:NAD(P)H-dependent FMN reductase